MIKIGKKIIGFLLSIIVWPEILNGFLFILVGAVFIQYYGYQIVWIDYFNLCLWYLLYKSALYCLTAILSGEVERDKEFSSFINKENQNMHVLIVRYFWVITIMFFVVSFLPIFQLMTVNKINGLSLAIITLIYLGDMVFLVSKFRVWLSGTIEINYAFVTAFLLPALFFSLTRNYLKASMVLITFPLFLQLIAWKITLNLDNTVVKKSIPLTSIIHKIGIPDSLSAAAVLSLLGVLTMFLDMQLVDILNKVVVLPLGFATAWFIMRSIRIQHPNWKRALFLVRLLPFATSFSIILSLLKN